MTDEECHWLPSPDAWRVRRGSEVVAWVNLELMKNAAEIGQMRRLARPHGGLHQRS